MPTPHDRIRDFLNTETVSTPALVLDLDQLVPLYEDFVQALPMARPYYAVKANPAIEVLEILVQQGACFDAASWAEVKVTLDAGARPQDICLGNTIKRVQDITESYKLGIRRYVFDSEAELAKLAEYAPGSEVICRVAVPSDGAAWPLAAKFGCNWDMAETLLLKSLELGLEPIGVSFHVGSQQANIHAWDEPIRDAAKLYQKLEDGHDLTLTCLNIGGGFPAPYKPQTPAIHAFGEEIGRVLAEVFGDDLPEIMVEPGRALVAEAGILVAEVVLISPDPSGEDRRWVYLDVGKYSGLTEAEAIQYAIETPGKDGPAGRVAIAGPTCDSADIIYQHSHYELPLSLEVGDRLVFLNAGAYVSCYSTAGFNGFPAPETIFLPATKATSKKPSAGNKKAYISLV